MLCSTHLLEATAMSGMHSCLAVAGHRSEAQRALLAMAVAAAAALAAVLDGSVPAARAELLGCACQGLGALQGGAGGQVHRLDTMPSIWSASW